MEVVMYLFTLLISSEQVISVRAAGSLSSYHKNIYPHVTALSPVQTPTFKITPLYIVKATKIKSPPFMVATSKNSKISNTPTFCKSIFSFSRRGGVVSERFVECGALLYLALGLLLPR